MISQHPETSLIMTSAPFFYIGNIPACHHVAYKYIQWDSIYLLSDAGPCLFVSTTLLRLTARDHNPTTLPHAHTVCYH